MQECFISGIDFFSCKVVTWTLASFCGVSVTISCLVVERCTTSRFCKNGQHLPRKKNYSGGETALAQPSRWNHGANAPRCAVHIGLPTLQSLHGTDSAKAHCCEAIWCRFIGKHHFVISACSSLQVHCKVLLGQYLVIASLSKMHVTFASWHYQIKCGKTCNVWGSIAIFVCCVCRKVMETCRTWHLLYWDETCMSYWSDCDLITFPALAAAVSHIPFLNYFFLHATCCPLEVAIVVLLLITG